MKRGVAGLVTKPGRFVGKRIRRLVSFVGLDAALMSMLTLDECDLVDRQIVNLRPRIDG